MGLERIHERHGLCKSPSYGCWCSMKNRCYQEDNNRFDIYGGRGITVCDRWLHSFSNFLADMGERPSPEHSIERKDTNGNYCPENCIWATPAEQNRNRSSNVILEFNGLKMCAADWDIHLGFSRNTVGERLRRGWSIERSLTTPPGQKPYETDDLKDRQFGKLTVIDFAGRIKNRTCWNCLCDCGATHVIRQDVLIRGSQPHCCKG